MMSKTKILAVILAATMSMSALTACGNTNEKANSETKEDTSVASEQEENSEGTVESTGIIFPLDEKVEFTAMAPNLGEKNLADSYAWKKLLEMANISVELTEAPNAETSEKASLLITSGEYPDFMFKSTAVGDAETYGMEGIYIPLEDLIREYAPNLTAILDERDGWNDITAADGHVYSLPYIDSPSVAARAYINREWLDNLGLSMPTNAEELYEVLKAFKEQDADGDGDPNNEIPFNFTASDNWYPVMYYLQYFCEGYDLLGNSSKGSSYFSVIDGEVVATALTDSFKNDFIAYLEKLYSEGLIYKDAFVLTNEEQQVMQSSGQVDGVTLAVRTSEIYAQYDLLLPFQENGFTMKNGITANAMAITDKCENPEILVALMDYLYTEEGGELACLGEEGVNYEKTAGGSYQYLDGVDEYDYIIRGFSPYPTLIPALANTVDSELEPEVKHKSDQDKMATEHAVIMPKLKYTVEELEIVNGYALDINTYINDYIASVVTGTTDLEETWEDYKATLEKMGIEDVRKAVADAYARAVSQ